MGWASDAVGPEVGERSDDSVTGDLVDKVVGNFLVYICLCSERSVDSVY